MVGQGGTLNVDAAELYYEIAGGGRGLVLLHDRLLSQPYHRVSAKHLAAYLDKLEFH